MICEILIQYFNGTIKKLKTNITIKEAKAYAKKFDKTNVKSILAKCFGTQYNNKKFKTLWEKKKK